MLKVKLGRNIEEDLEKMSKLREEVPKRTRIRVDPNQGYGLEELIRFCRETEELDVEFLEQPMPADEIEPLQQLPEKIRTRLAADESLHHP